MMMWMIMRQRLLTVLRVELKRGARSTPIATAGAIQAGHGQRAFGGGSERAGAMDLPDGTKTGTGNVESASSDSISSTRKLPLQYLYESFDFSSEDPMTYQRSLDCYRNTFDRVLIPDSLERVVNRHMTMAATGAEMVYRMLLARGTEYVFGYSGGAVLPLIDCFHAASRSSSRILAHSHSRVSAGIEFINMTNEQSAAHAAQAAGRITGKPGVVVVTSGPGVTNCITALQDALMDGDPLILISGQVATSSLGTDAFQECPATMLTKPCTKWNYLAKSVNELPWALETALRIAMSGRKGPVHIDVPKDILAGEGHIPLALVCPGLDRDMGEASARRANAVLIAQFDYKTLDEVARRIALSLRPVLIAGHGASHCSNEVLHLVEKINVPVTTTLHGMGILDEEHPLSLHMHGMHGSPYGNFAIQDADLIISAGARFDDRTTGALSKYALKAREAGRNGTGGIVHFDIERSQVGKTVQPDLHILADCKYTLRKLIAAVKPKRHPDWIAKIQTLKTAYTFAWVRDQPSGVLKTQQVVERINSEAKSPRFQSRGKRLLITTGVGNHQMMTAQFFRWRTPTQLVTSGGLGTMGTGLPFAIGAQVACPQCCVLLIDGDGSFNMSLSELSTVQRFKLPVKIAIMNDGVQQMVRAWQRLFFDGRYVVTENRNPDYVKIAEAYNIRALSCDAELDLDGAVEQLLFSDGPILIDFRVAPDFCFPLVAPGTALDHMILSKHQVPPTTAELSLQRAATNDHSTQSIIYPNESVLPASTFDPAQAPS